MPNFNEVANMRADEVQRPTPPPLGTYVGVIAKQPEPRKITARGVEQEVLDFDIQLVSPFKDVSSDALAEWSDKFGQISAMRPLQRTFFIESAEGRWGMTQFLSESLGIEKAGKSLGQMCAEAVGRQVLVTIGHRPYQDRNGQMQLGAEIAGTARV